ncbi:unnamed protein product [Adineta steineri]|uniref:Uncharacterized protein n=1 Tax=Adineta steineri TaxID=433720 RepID=A0A813SFZ5_9BILA|nr:unnamed protein product [Adineta steineri]CAF0794061.1 unnamed protein product [Adineta steineri]
MIFIWVLLLFSGVFPSIQTLSCINFEYEEPAYIDTFDRNALKEKLDRFEMDASLSACRVEMVFVYSTGLLTLKFSKLVPKTTISVGIVTFRTLVRYTNKDDTTTIHVLTAACSNSDGCDKQFILNHVDWFIRLKYDDFFKISFQLLVGEDDKIQRCSHPRCPNRFCGVGWTHKETDIVQGCSELPRAQFQARNDFNINTRKETESFAFFCGYDQCNSLDVVSKLQANVKENYNILLVRKALGFDNESDNSMATTSSTLNITFFQYFIENMSNVSSLSLEDTTVTQLSMITNSSAMTKSASTLVTTKTNGCTTWQFQKTNIIMNLNAMIILLIIY